jgi:hypothetical protein
MRRVKDIVLALAKYVATSVLLALYINLLSNAISTSHLPWLQVVLGLGKWNLLAGSWCVLVAFILLLEARRRSSLAADMQRATNSFVNVISQSLEFPFNAFKVNVHLYAKTKAKGRTMLRKIREINREVDHMPDNYALDMIDVEKDNLVTCESFLHKQAIYRILPENHPDFYHTELRAKVDPAIRWVLSCPFWVASTTGEPAGVLVFYGREPGVPEASANFFRNIGLLTAEQLGLLIHVENELANEMDIL